MTFSEAEQGLEYVVVTYRAELELLRLQARSFAKFVPSSLVRRIVIAVNDADMMFCFNYIYRNVLPEFGCHSSKVRVVELGMISPGATGFSGYVSQQILKIMISKFVEGRCYIVLDGKNFFIGPVSYASFFSEESGLPRAKFEQYEANFQCSIISSCYELFDVPSSVRVNYLPAMMTPFAVHKEIALELIERLEKKKCLAFEAAFFQSLKVHSEFLMYSTFIVSEGIDYDDLYAPCSAMSLTLWKGYCLGADALSGALKRARETGCLMIGVHSNRVAQMGVEEHDVMLRFLSDIDLFSAGDGFRFRLVE